MSMCLKHDMMRITSLRQVANQIIQKQNECSASTEDMNLTVGHCMQCVQLQDRDCVFFVCTVMTKLCLVSASY